MANRKLQKDIDIIFKRVQEGLKDFNYHNERYESLQNVEDDSDLQREREKLANDLKKEIKKLQKHREQIKHWLSNDAVNTLGPVGTSYSAKLLENKSLVEDAMETYKVVERQTKLKSFSNQSIMMNMLETNREEESESEDTDEDLAPDALDAIQFLKDFILQLDESTEKLNHEFEKISLKKVRKNNLSTIEAKKDKIQQTIVSNNLHQKKCKKLIRHLKNDTITDFSLVNVLKDELEKYLKDDEVEVTELYEDILHEESSAPPPTVPLKPAATAVKPVATWTTTTAATTSATTPPTATATTPPTTTGSIPPTTTATTATTPPRTNGTTVATTPPPATAPPTTTTRTTSRTTSTTTAKPNVDSEYYKNIIKASALSKTETNLFSDLNLVRVPPGIQDLVISFASKRNNEEFKILIDDESNKFNQFISPLHKPYLPDIVQPNYYFQFTNFNFKHPTQLVKFQNYWNEVRSNSNFDELAEKINNDLIFVFFYGFYYGLTPAENLIAERYLFKLGWKPYNADKKLYYWFKNIKVTKEDSQFEVGDYQVFDLNFWEIFVKYNFKLDYNLCSKPSKSLF